MECYFPFLCLITAYGPPPVLPLVLPHLPGWVGPLLGLVTRRCGLLQLGHSSHPRTWICAVLWPKVAELLVPTSPALAVMPLGSGLEVAILLTRCGCKPPEGTTPSTAGGCRVGPGYCEAPGVPAPRPLLTSGHGGGVRELFALLQSLCPARVSHSEGSKGQKNTAHP